MSLDTLCEPTFTFLKKEVRVEEKDVLVGGARLRLVPLQHRLITYLNEHRGYVRTKRMIFDALYPDRAFPEVRLINVLTCILGKTFKDVGVPGLLGQRWGRGSGLALNQSGPEPLPELVSRKTVTGIGGKRITSDDLPDPSQRWVARRKANVATLVSKGVVPLEYVLARYPDMKADEIDEWVKALATTGLFGLKNRTIGLEQSM